MNNLGVNALKMSALFILISCGLDGVVCAGKLAIRYERPESPRYLKVYKMLKGNHKSMYGESAKYIAGLYDWEDDITVVVTSCGAVDSRYQVDNRRIVICYESLYQKIYDYPNQTQSKEQFEKRVYQNAMFTFWHEMGHALMDQFDIGESNDPDGRELLADEFATLSMLWRNDSYWKGILMISALHFQSKSVSHPDKMYENHPPDELRYQKIITLLYGFAQKSYSKLESEVNRLDWLDISAQKYYLERSTYWKQNLRCHTRTDFFNN